MLEEYKLNGMEKQKNSSVQWKNKSISTKAATFEDNIVFTKFDKVSKLLTTDVISGLHNLEGKYTFDIIFMDPPYRQGLEEDVLRFLSKSDILKPDTKIIVEASLDTDFSYLDELGFDVLKFKKYKTNMHVFIQKR